MSRYIRTAKSILSLAARVSAPLQAFPLALQRSPQALLIFRGLPQTTSNSPHTLFQMIQLTDVSASILLRAPFGLPDLPFLNCEWADELTVADLVRVRLATSSAVRSFS